MTTDKQARKERPIARGVLDYFPDAIAEVANVSYVGSQQHHPDKPMHWDKSKSPDHADCLARHLIERGTFDTDGVRHSAKAAWRALAMLQIEIEDDADVADAEVILADPAQVPQKFFDRPEREADFRDLIQLGCSDRIARLIVIGTTYTSCPFRKRTFDPTEVAPYAYVAGPMRSLPFFNFPTFDEARDQLVKSGYNVISPADIDRGAGDTDAANHIAADQRDYVFRDFWALYFLAKKGKHSSIVMLRNYERSTGATAELGLAKWLGLKVKFIEEVGCGI